MKISLTLPEGSNPKYAQKFVQALANSLVTREADTQYQRGRHATATVVISGPWPLSLDVTHAEVVE